MRIRFKCLMVALVAAVALPPIAFAQIEARKANNAAPEKFDPHDLAGIWQREGDRGINPRVPAMTPAGLTKFNCNKPSYGRSLGSPLNGEHIGRVRAVPPAQGNSLVGDCKPPGVPRLYFEPEPVEFIKGPDKLLQFFSW